MTQSLDTNQRARLYQHGDDNLFTLLSAFQVARSNPTRYTYMSVPTRDLYHLSLRTCVFIITIAVFSVLWKNMYLCIYIYSIPL